MVWYYGMVWYRPGGCGCIYVPTYLPTYLVGNIWIGIFYFGSRDVCMYICIYMYILGVRC